MFDGDRELIRSKCAKDLREFEAFSKLDLSGWYAGVEEEANTSRNPA